MDKERKIYLFDGKAVHLKIYERFAALAYMHDWGVLLEQRLSQYSPYFLVYYLHYLLHATDKAIYHCFEEIHIF